MSNPNEEITPVWVFFHGQSVRVSDGCPVGFCKEEFDREVLRVSRTNAKKLRKAGRSDVEVPAPTWAPVASIPQGFTGESWKARQSLRFTATDEAAWHDEYRAYMVSAEWKTKKRELFRVRGRRCERCGRDGKPHAHHITYERLGQERLEDLEVLCEFCHLRHHGQMIGINNVETAPQRNVGVEEYLAGK